jgi:leucyl-tRNA synthetase
MKKTCYVLDMFPYPSGEGLHVGHPKGYVATDIYSRYKKMLGYDVIHPMGWDAFGLPAEQYAIKNKVHPRAAVEKNIANFKKQLENLDFDYDWDREISTTDPEFYRWTQWIFKQLYKKGLAYEVYEPINWCPSCKTGLANEDLDGNNCERCGSTVEKKPLRQWSLRITDYADRMISDLDKLAWPEWVKIAQKNWIGRSEGSEIDFKVQGKDFDSKFTVFTTRADTLFGCTYTVLAPEHALVRELLDKNIITNKSEVEKYILEVKDKTDIERGAEGREKTGVKLEGVMAINPANQKEVPVYIADYVLASYGTGAIMAVPAHDERDGEFAKKYGIEVIVLDVNDTDEERKKITEAVGGKLVKKYKLRDWVFARQRYWGEPFPIVYATNEDGIADHSRTYVVADSELPILLPNVESYEPTGTGESPLANIKEFTDVYGYINDQDEFVSCDKSDPRAKLFKRETNTMPQWAGSSWYYLRFLDPKNSSALIDKDIEKKWQHDGATVDLYVGGDHATRHLIYARFWHKFLFDIGVVTTEEPFGRLEFLGFILAPDGSKMSKSKGNTINPDDIVKEFGSDTFRIYEMFMAPFEATAIWSTSSIKGVKRFVERVEKLQSKIGNPCQNQNIIHQTIKKVGEDIEGFKFNTAVSQMMIALNEFEAKGISQEEYDKFMSILAPFAPNVSNKYTKSAWPDYDQDKLTANEVTIVVQINGKLRGEVIVAKDVSDEDVLLAVKSSEIWSKFVTTEPKKIITIKNKLVNIVI